MYKVSIPGSTMILGEHAVLQGKAAIVSAIDKKIDLELLVVSKSEDPTISIISDQFLPYMTKIKDLKQEAPLTFILQALTEYKDALMSKRHSLQLHIKSHFPATVGLGSSSAVVVGTHLLLQEFLYEKHLTQQQLFDISYETVLAVQGYGSGADLAASIYGGTLFYKMGTVPERLPSLPSMQLVYVGYKTPTPVVIKMVLDNYKKNQTKYNEIFKQQHMHAVAARKALLIGNTSILSTIFDEHFLLQQQLGVSDANLDKLVHLLQPGAKISGSGLGDCVISLNLTQLPNYQRFLLSTTKQGAVSYV